MNKFYSILLSSILFSFFLQINIYCSDVGTQLEMKENKYADNHKIKGRIVDSKTGEPIIGATIAVKGTNTGTISDMDGNFSISVQDTSAILSISYVGYKNQEIVVNNQKEVTVSLEMVVKELDEVVVIGYGTQKKADLMGAVSTVSSKEITSIPVTDVTQAIQGKAAGVDVVSNSGSPGAVMSIKIRGTGTVNNTDPLYVVDGLIVDDISYLNSEDIKDLNILKDASSAAIYGARAANGVVVISTKRGEKGLRVSVNTYAGFSQFWKTPDLLDKKGFSNLYSNLHPTQDLLGSPKNLYIYNNYSANDWMKYIIGTGSTQKYNLQVSGGDDKNTYMISGSWNSDNGIVKRTNFHKGDIRINMDNKITKNITIRSSFQATLNNRSMVQEGQFNVFQYALREPPVNPLFDMGDDKFTYAQDNKTIIGYNKVYVTSPYTRLYGVDLNSSANGFVGNFEIITKIAKTLTNRTQAGFDYEFFTEKDFSGRNFQPYSYYDGNNNSLGINYSANAVQQTNNNKVKWQAENVTTFSKKIGNNNITLIGGVTFEGYNETQTFAARSNAPNFSDPYNALNAAYVNPQINGFGNGWRAIGIPFRADYSYAEKYLLQFNLRADASSIFMPSNRWGAFPSISAGWKLNEESFFKNVDWISLLKVRANWGLAGNNRIDQYGAYTMIYTDPSFYYVTGQNPFYRAGWASKGIGNPDIKWESTDSKNAGIDISLFKGSISGSVDFFDKTTSNMLLQLPLVISSGMTTVTNAPWQNVGKVRNMGYEVYLDYKKSIRNFTFEIGGNFTQINNRVLNLGTGNNPVLGGFQPGNADLLASNYLTETAVGHSIGEFYGYKIDKSLHANGIWHTGDNINGSPTPLGVNKDNIIPGDFIFKDVNGDGVIDQNDKTFLGSPLPDFTYGFNINLKYKIVELSMFFQGVHGNKIFNEEKYWMDAYHPSSTSGAWIQDNNVAKDLMANAYTPTNQDAKYPLLRTVTTDNNGNYRVSDFYIEDGSYLRLKNVQLGINLPEKICSAIKVSKIRVFASAYNLLTFTKYSGMDPEIGRQVNTATVGNVNTANSNTSNTSIGIDLGSYPQARTYTFGLSVDF